MSRNRLFLERLDRSGRCQGLLGNSRLERRCNTILAKRVEPRKVCDMQFAMLGAQGELNIGLERHRVSPLPGVRQFWRVGAVA